MGSGCVSMHKLLMPELWLLWICEIVSLQLFPGCFMFVLYIQICFWGNTIHSIVSRICDWSSWACLWLSAESANQFCDSRECQAWPNLPSVRSAGVFPQGIPRATAATWRGDEAGNCHSWTHQNVDWQQLAQAEQGTSRGPASWATNRLWPVGPGLWLLGLFLFFYHYIIGPIPPGWPGITNRRGF
jgi:hypothetical protein